MVAMSDAPKSTSLSRFMQRFAPRVVRRFVRTDDGAAAVEFAMVAAPFIAIIFAIFETAIVFFAGQVLEVAMADSARLIMTGQAQKAGFNQAKFKEEVCNRIYGLFDCTGGIMVDVRTYTSFSSATMSKPIDANGNLTFTPAFDPGKAGDIVVVRMMYEWPVYASLLGFNLADLGSGKRLLMATAAFRNEPYE
jgi:Flp pilus assembly protein TadG